MKLEKLMKKKQMDEMDPADKQAKMSVLQALRKEMGDMMKDDLHGHNMKSVQVAAPDKQGLEEGLDKAKDLLGAESDMDNEHDPEEADHELEGDDELPQENDMDESEDLEDPEHEDGGQIIADQIEHEGSEGELTPEEIEQLEKLLAKVKMRK